MSDLFRVHKVTSTDASASFDVPAYFIESTAPNNVEEYLPPLVSAPGLSKLDPDAALDEIAAYLHQATAPEIVLTVHGFNNPLDIVLKRYRQAFEDVRTDPSIRAQQGLICIGYRWPSEQVGWPKNTLWSAAPALLQVLVCTAITCFCFSLGSALILRFHLASFGIHWLPWAFSIFGCLCLAVPLTAMALRIIVYFRDGYRAASYGIPDLVEIIRQLDLRLQKKETARAHAEGCEPRRNRVKLSFIGHSMGGFVVTGAVRILSDIFSPAAIHGAVSASVTGFRPSNPPLGKDLTVAELIQQGASSKYGPPEVTGGLDAGLLSKAPTSAIGHAFALGRLILVSPDIPAETLLSSRANFLASSLLRFEEAYLFSSGGDEVLRQVSTVANYFSFPTRSRKNGFRLGNAEVLADRYGLTNLEWLQAHPDGDAGTALLDALRIGQLTLHGLSAQFGDCDQVQNGLAQAFTYFDCTDYREDGKGILTWAKAKRAPKRSDQMSGWDHFWLLLTYATGRLDVHSGYFDAPFSRSLIYRLACLGFAGTVEAVRTERSGIESSRQHVATGAQSEDASLPPDHRLAEFSAACAEKQIKVLLSPRAYADHR